MTFTLRAAVVLALLLAQDPELEAALKADRARIAGRKALTKDESAGYKQVEAQVSEKRRTFRLKTVPVSFTDVAPSRADLSKTLLEPLSAYYKAQSSGVLQFESSLLEP